MMFNSENRHMIERRRQEPKRRLLTVETATRLTPHMVRIAFRSPDLAGFASYAPDDHIKLFLPDPQNPGRQVMRDYTPRAFDEVRNILTIDFVAHQAGPAAAWALAAKPGDTLTIGGPRGSAIVADDFDYYLLIGDETALPSIGRRVEELRRNARVATIVVVDGPEDEQQFNAKADWLPIWVHRRGETADDSALLRRALDQWRAPPGDGYVWIAAEARVAQTLRGVMLAERGHNKSWLKASGYWVRGLEGASAKTIED